MDQKKPVKEPPPIVCTLALKDRGEVCKRRGIPLIDLYLTGEGGKGAIGLGCWMSGFGLSVPHASAIASWFKAHGVKVERSEASSDPSHSRNLFSEVK